jgi:glycosyltransferase involved in cell wall biosynthesis
MRLIFLYTANGQASPMAKISWDPARPTKNRFAVGFQEEGYSWLIRRMLETGVIEECLVFVESVHDTGSLEYMSYPAYRSYVLPQIRLADPYIKPGDVIWARGGFRTWHDYLVELGKRGHWLLLYGANTGRERWPFWHVVFNDVAGRDLVDRAGRVHLDFRKPTHERIFYPMDLPVQYDLCIGASHIHDKKGQWRAVNMISFLQECYKKRLHCIMPGSDRGGVKTDQMFNAIREARLDVELPGMVPRTALNRIYNASKVFIHLGAHGQGDRGPIEAMRCGCPVWIGYPQYHAPWMISRDGVCSVPSDPENLEAAALDLERLVETYDPAIRKVAREHYEAQAGVETVSLPRMRQLFGLFRQHPEADRGWLRKELAL